MFIFSTYSDYDRVHNTRVMSIKKKKLVKVQCCGESKKLLFWKLSKKEIYNRDSVPIRIHCDTNAAIDDGDSGSKIFEYCSRTSLLTDGMIFPDLPPFGKYNLYKKKKTI